MMTAFRLLKWESFSCSNLGVSPPGLIGPVQQSVCNSFTYNSFGDHLQTCQVKSTDSKVHDWVVYKLGVILGSETVSLLRNIVLSRLKSKNSIQFETCLQF